MMMMMMMMMMHLYSALLCIVVHPKRFTIMSLLNHHQYIYKYLNIYICNLHFSNDELAI